MWSQSDERPWLRHYPFQVSSSYEYPKMNVARLLLDSARDYPNREALDFLGRSYSYKELLRLCTKLANALKSQIGISKGERLAIMLPNCPQAVIAYYAGLMAGAVIVMTNPIYTERELRYQLADSGATTLIALDLLVPRALKAREGTSIKRIIVTSLSDGLPFPQNKLYPLKRRREHPGLKIKYKASEGILRWSAVMRQGKAEPICEEIESDRDLAMLQYTGGTTGQPKGVMLTHANLLANTKQISAWFHRLEQAKEKFLAALPLFHVFGLTVLLNLAIFKAGSMLLVPRFDPRMVLQTIRRRKPTVFPGAPTMYIALLNSPLAREGDFGSVRVCVSGAAPLPREVQERFEQQSGGRLIEGYGMTEASPVTHCNPVWGFRKSGTIGIPLPDTEARIVGPDSLDPLPLGEIGELAVRGPQVMAGYWNRPEETDAVLRDGWLRTGDLGSMDDDGFFSIMDRKKDIILAGGYNVYPREVEEALFEHPAVKEASVIGVPDDYRGETVKAYIVLKEGWQVSEMQLDRWCRDRLAAFKVPKRYEFRDSLPLTIIGKVLKRKLKEDA
ncbi:long-chain fatty acid--CoA ligase [Cohnella endophytica]|uniref:Long-chain fatty acid--CoA ligase n=1 Tax=Cohnella endophytica TaxID=2419778 RepID=A0A494XRM8_9BACL|nr:long-chain fatty acid--CoA ligase [Cohnella endophytica]RKP50173.1 long-chain fatty acid--CoA ligase [Cohnella endophytica]